MQCAIQLKRSGTKIPRIELVEIGPSMDLVVRRLRLPNDDARKEVMKSAPEEAKKVKNVIRDAVQGKLGKIYVPDQKVGEMRPSNDVKGLKRERREAKMKRTGKESPAKTPKLNSET